METQLQFLDTEIKSANDRLAMLQSIRDILTDKVAAELASLPPLVAAKEALEIENAHLKANGIQIDSREKVTTP